MNAGDFLKQVEEKGIRVRAHGEDLAVSGPKDALTPAIPATPTNPTCTTRR